MERLGADAASRFCFERSPMRSVLEAWYVAGRDLRCGLSRGILCRNVRGVSPVMAVSESRVLVRRLLERRS